MFFPNGIIHYLYGGILLGLSVAILYYLTGYILGASTSLNAILSFITKTIPASFRKYRLLFFIGIIVGAFFVALTQGFITTTIPSWRLFLGGIFIGLGATLARGCTSGHGICGLGSKAKSSVLYVAIFVVVAILTANVLKWVGL